MDPNTAQLLFFGVIIVVIIALMFRNGRKRQRDQQALSAGLQPGAEVMTSFGVYGTIVSIDDAENRVVLRTGPNSELTIHRQAVGRVVTPVAEDGAVLNGEPVVLDDAATDPTYGERLDGASFEGASSEGASSDVASSDVAARRLRKDGE